MLSNRMLLSAYEQYTKSHNIEKSISDFYYKFYEKLEKKVISLKHSSNLNKLDKYGEEILYDLYKLVIIILQTNEKNVNVIFKDILSSFYNVLETIEYGNLLNQKKEEKLIETINSFLNTMQKEDNINNV